MKRNPFKSINLNSKPVAIILIAIVIMGLMGIIVIIVSQTYLIGYQRETIKIRENRIHELIEAYSEAMVDPEMLDETENDTIAEEQTECTNELVNEFLLRKDYPIESENYGSGEYLTIVGTDCTFRLVDYLDANISIETIKREHELNTWNTYVAYPKREDSVDEYILTIYFIYVNEYSSDVVFASYVPETKVFQELYRFENDLVAIDNLFITADSKYFILETGIIATGCGGEEDCDSFLRMVKDFQDSGISGLWLYNIETGKMTQIYKETDFSH